jgi:hypothetical protein
MLIPFRSSCSTLLCILGLFLYLIEAKHFWNLISVYSKKMLIPFRSSCSTLLSDKFDMSTGIYTCNGLLMHTKKVWNYRSHIFCSMACLNLGKSYTLPECLWRLHHLIFLNRLISPFFLSPYDVACLHWLPCLLCIRCQTSADRCVTPS